MRWLRSLFRRKEKESFCTGICRVVCGDIDEYFTDPVLAESVAIKISKEYKNVDLYDLQYNHYYTYNNGKVVDEGIILYG